MSEALLPTELPWLSSKQCILLHSEQHSDSLRGVDIFLYSFFWNTFPREETNQFEFHFT